MEFTTLTELEVLKMAYSKLLAMLDKEYKFLDKNPKDCIALARLKKLELKHDELHQRIIYLENLH